MSTTSIKENVLSFQSKLTNTNCQLIAVTKTKPVALIMEAYNAGLITFGENRVQELVEKWRELPKDIEWHMIGHLQRNKVKHIAPFVAMIHSVESLKLLREINKQALINHRIIHCLLQVHIAKEESKFGFEASELLEIIKQTKWSEYQGVRIMGLMGMATFCDDEVQIRDEFRSLNELFRSIDKIELPENIQMKELSMGMSGDYQIALEEGSTMIRVGSAIFGARY